MIYAWIGAVLIGVCLGLLGSGGSIITVPILVYLVGHEEKAAIAEALAIVGSIALFGAARRGLDGRVDWRSVLAFGAPGMAGAALGAWAAHWIPGAVQVLALGGIMLLAAAMMVRARGVRGGSGPERAAHPHWAAAAGAGVVVGCVTGLVGVGGGFLIVPALTLLLGVPLAIAVGTSLAIIAMNAAVGFALYQSVLGEHDLSVNWRTVALFAGLGIAGSVVGDAAGSRINQRTLRRIFAAFLVLMAAYIVWTQSGKVFGV